MHRLSKSLAALAGLLVVSMLLIAAEHSALQSQTKTQVEGVWKIAEALMPSKNAAEKGTTITNPHASLMGLRHKVRLNLYKARCLSFLIRRGV
ncbi:MAG: hypothetical protein ACRD6N_01730 [Pyrinomonadaceae bacterium]